MSNAEAPNHIWTIARWMTALPDNIPISKISIPGSHNSAAINTRRRTRWACQDHSIADQLNNGIRLLDIRLKPKQQHRTRAGAHEPEPRYAFVTCHGHRGLFGANEFQPFAEVQQECTEFLKENPGETIIMTLKIDDWRQVRHKDQALAALKTQLTHLPLFITPALPTLGECRGKIYLFNRINDDPALGVPLNIPDNTPGATLPKTKDRNYEIYVQDQYKNLDRGNPEAHKLRLTLEAFNQKLPGAVLLNFASATKPIARFVYIMPDLETHLSQARPADPRQNPIPPVWLFLDYVLTTDLPTLLIAANFN